LPPALEIARDDAARLGERHAALAFLAEDHGAESELRDEETRIAQPAKLHFFAPIDQDFTEPASSPRTK
jgi:hypothetical protein